ncbi:helix-turn-helix domain-containing protein [Alcaligenaceae bacterium]|nr:helix-turn-helix domain-containing protein [Alcaligenaceae bacterium]
MLSVIEAAKRLGVSPRTVYDLAAPSGPIPCHRIGRRIVFSTEDLTEYLHQCRYTEIKREVATFLSSTVSLRASGSGLENYFRKRGREPKLTPTTAKNRRDSTPLQLVSNGKNTG